MVNIRLLPPIVNLPSLGQKPMVWTPSPVSCPVDLRLGLCTGSLSQEPGRALGGLRQQPGPGGKGSLAGEELHRECLWPSASESQRRSLWLQKGAKERCVDIVKGGRRVLSTHYAHWLTTSDGSVSCPRQWPCYCFQLAWIR